jgi:hypothetical protein
MLRLFANVFNDLFQLRSAHAERAVFLPPSEQAMLWKRLVNPFRRTAFDQLHRLRHGHRGRQREQNVKVVFHAADFDGLHLVLPRDAAEERPEAFAQFRRDERAAFFCAENAMNIRADEGYINSELTVNLFCHPGFRCFSRPCGACPIRDIQPQLKLPAIFICACGTETGLAILRPDLLLNRAADFFGPAFQNLFVAAFEQQARLGLGAGITQQHAAAGGFQFRFR